MYPKHYDYYSITITLSLLPYNYYAQRASETISYCFGWCHTLGIANNSQATAQHFLSIPAQDPAAFCLKHSVLTSKHSVYLHWLVHTRVHTHRHSLYFSLSLYTHSLFTLTCCMVRGLRGLTRKMMGRRQEREEGREGMRGNRGVIDCYD